MVFPVSRSKEEIEKFLEDKIYSKKVTQSLSQTVKANFAKKFGGHPEITEILSQNFMVGWLSGVNVITDFLCGEEESSKFLAQGLIDGIFSEIDPELYGKEAPEESLKKATEDLIAEIRDYKKSGEMFFFVEIVGNRNI